MDWRPLFAAGRNGEAEPLLEQEVVRESTPGEATLFLGAVRSLLHGHRQFLDAAAEACRSNVTDDLWLVVVGSTLWDIGLRDEGAARLREAVAANPSQQNLEVAAARLEKTPGCFHEAVSLYDRLLSRGPRTAVALVGRGSAKARLAQQLLDEARADFEAAIQCEPDEASGFYEMGNLLASQGQYQEALTYFRSAVKLGYRGLHRAHAGVAFCLQKLGQISEALESAKESLRISPNYGYAKEIVEELEATATDSR